MVSKGKILGKSALIFVTVGSTNFQFNRLFSAIDESVLKLHKNIFLEVQAGNSQYRWRNRNTNIRDYLRSSKMIEFFKKADKIISHAGPASIYLSVKYSKNVPLIVPRLFGFGEHVDNHQLHFISFLRQKVPRNMSKFFVIDRDFQESIFNYLKEEPKKNILRQYLFQNSNTTQLYQKLTKFIETNLK